jgi:hypothetical protein
MPGAEPPFWQALFGQARRVQPATGVALLLSQVVPKA